MKCSSFEIANTSLFQGNLYPPYDLNREIKIYIKSIHDSKLTLLNFILNNRKLVY